MFIMDDFDDSYKDAIEAGQRNLRATKLLNNWCFHAEIARTPGRGLIEAETGLPIGHMGVQCKFSKKNSMHCWLLEDAAFDFYVNNCKSCEKRISVGLPNIMEFVGPREAAAEQRKTAREEEEKDRKQKRLDRQHARALLRHELSLEETFVLDLLDDLDQDDIAKDDPRLEQLANLAPETFTRKVIEHILPAIIYEHLPYSIPAGKALLRAQLKPEVMLQVAVSMVRNYVNSTDAINTILSNPESLSESDLAEVLPHFVSMAIGPPPGLQFGISDPIRLDAEPIQTLFQKRKSEICAKVNELINDKNPAKIGAAIEIILATDSDELLSSHIRDALNK